jgi:hypothetical protein
VQRDITNMKNALAASGVTEGFLPVASPSSVIPDRRNEFYKSEDDIMHAIASAMVCCRGPVPPLAGRNSWGADDRFSQVLAVRS